MNKAFVREPESDGNAFCPGCGSLGIAVEAQTLDEHIRPESRHKLHDSGWYCRFPHCDVAYFNLFAGIVRISELKGPVYPHDFNAPICACFGLTYDDVEADVREVHPKRIRELLARSKSPEAHCGRLAADGRCCIGAVQELYMKLRSRHEPP